MFGISSWISQNPWPPLTASQLGLQNILIFTFIFTFLTWYIQYRWSRRRLYEISNKLDGPKLIPFFGNALWFAGDTENILKSIREICSKWPTPSRVWLGTRLYIPIAKPKDLEVILNKCLKKDEMYVHSQSVTGQGLFSAESVARWKKHRKIIQPTFNQKILDSFMGVFNEQSILLVEKLKPKMSKGNFDVFTYIGRCTLDIVCESAIGIKVNAQEHESMFVKAANMVMEIIFLHMFQVWYHIDFIYKLSSLSREEKKYCDYIHNFSGKVIREKRAEYERRKANLDIHEEEPKWKPFLQLLIENTDFTDQELNEEVTTVIIGGNDTSGCVNSFVCIMLGIYQDVQEKVYQEITEVFGDSDRPVEVTDLPRLKYLEMVIKETMRMFPVGPVIVRSVTEDIQLDSCVLPSGCSCVLAIIQTHFDPEIWVDPYKFNPERFLPEECAKRHPYSWIPFSAGPRNCIGLKYAMMQMKVLLATVLRKYRFKSNYKYEDIRLKVDLMLKPVNGFITSIEPRNPIDK